MLMCIKNVGRILYTAYKAWIDKDPFRQSAIIAYYAIFSLPGLLVLIISLAGYFFEKEAVSNHIFTDIATTMGVETSNQIREMILKAGANKDSVWASIIGGITIIVGATGVLVQFQKSLNIIWEVKPDPAKEGVWSIVKARLFSFGLIISTAFILLISLVITSILTVLGNWIQAHLPDIMTFVFQAITFIVSLTVIASLFALMFKFLPDAKIKWRNVWIGSLVTALLFEIGKFGLGLYFGKANPGEGYGPAGSVILILLWASYSSMIVFYGAEFTKAYTQFHDGKIKPAGHAIKVPQRKDVRTSDNYPSPER